MEILVEKDWTNQDEKPEKPLLETFPTNFVLEIAKLSDKIFCTISDLSIGVETSKIVHTNPLDHSVIKTVCPKLNSQFKSSVLIHFEPRGE